MPFNITRNGIVKALSETMFGKKSPNSGVKFYTPTIDVDKEDDRTWTGVDQLNGMINRGLRLIFADIWLGNLKRNEGVFDEEEFLEEAADFTAARQSLADIETEIDDLQALQQSYTIENPAWEGYVPTEPMNEVQAGLMKQVHEGNAKIKALRVKRDAIEKEYTLRAQKRAVTKAANEAKKKAGTVATPAVA